MKICFILEHFHPHIGGAETIFKGLATHLAKLGHEVRVVTSDSGGIDGRTWSDGVEVIHFPWRQFFGHPIPNRKDLRQFVDWADIVHTGTYTSGPIALAAAKCLNKPCIITVYESLNEKWFWIERNPIKATMFWAFEKYVVRQRYSFFHAISQATARDLIRAGVGEGMITVVYPGVSDLSLAADPRNDRTPNSRMEPSGDRKTFLYFGRPGQTKGIFVLLEAIKRIANDLPKGFQFVFILSNDPRREKERLRSKIVEAGLSRLIAIRDPVSRADLIEAIRGAYCVVIPSITEGFGFSAAEACALGAPVIASNAGSLPEVVSGKALFFHNRSSKSLAEQLLRAVKGDFELIPGKAFEWEVATSRLLEIYETLIRQDGTPSETSNK